MIGATAAPGQLVISDVLMGVSTAPNKWVCASKWRNMSVGERIRVDVGVPGLNTISFGQYDF